MSGAALALHLTQSAVSRAMQALESDLGVSLIIRGKTGSRLTTEGSIFALRVRRFFEQLAAALADTCGAGDKIDGSEKILRRIGTAQFRALVAVWHAHNVADAARMLGIAYPTLYRAARDLEHLVDTPLFRSTSLGTGLSPAGVELARRFILAAKEIDAGVEEILAQADRAKAVMTIGVPPLAPMRLLAIAGENLFKSGGNTPGGSSGLSVHEALYDDLIYALRCGAIDLIFGALRLPLPFDDLAAERCFVEPHAIVCRRNHPLLQKKKPTPEALKSYGWVFPTAVMPRRTVLDRLIRKWNLSANVQIETSALGMIISTLTESDRLSLLPRCCAEDRSEQLAVVPVDVAQPTRWVGLTSRKGWLPSPSQRDMLDHLRQAIGSSQTARQPA